MQRFEAEQRVAGRGAIAILLQLSDLLKDAFWPFSFDQVLTSGQGQVRSLSGSRLARLLRKHDVSGTLSREGGRTNAGSLQIAKAYVTFLNAQESLTQADLEMLERYWAGRAQTLIQTLSAPPLRLRQHAGRSVNAWIEDLIAQARAREREGEGTKHTGAMLQHLVGAKLEVVTGAALTHHGSSVADGPTARDGDFDLNPVVVHVTTSPSEALVRKCGENLDRNLRPLIVTLEDRVATARGLLADAGIGPDVDCLSVQQFLTGNVHELNARPNSTQEGLAAILERYNEIVAAHEADGSLRVEL